MNINLSENTPIDQVIAAVISIADEMLDASENEDYETFAALDSRRIACLAWIFDAGVDVSSRFQQLSVQDQRIALEKLLLSNDVLVAVTIKNRDQLASKLTQINKAQQVAKAYTSFPAVHF